MFSVTLLLFFVCSEDGTLIRRMSVSLDQLLVMALF